jgi:hypothetical protein
VSQLLHTLILCGLLSGTQPLTLMGLLIVLGGATPRRNGIAFLCGTFLIQTTLLLGASLLFGGTVKPVSGLAQSFYGLRMLVGLVLLVFGLLLRRPPGKPVPEIPHALERLRDLRPLQSFIAGIVVADYQGPVLASFALAAASVSFAGELEGLLVYTVIATGLPLALMLWTTRSERARERITRATTWVMSHRRALVSWFGIVAGLLLIGDGAISLLTT